jgi:hypothetical protein
MRACISGGMLAIICCICCIWSGDIPCGIPWEPMPWGPIADDASGAEPCVVVAPCAGVEFSAAAAASFFFDSADSMARTTLLLTPAWLSACSPVEERSNWVSRVAMAFTMVASGVPAFTIFTTSLLVSGALFCCAVRLVALRKSAPIKMLSFSSRITRRLLATDLCGWKVLGP